MTKVFLLTGATGFVGRQVLSELLRRGMQVRVVVRCGKEHLFESHTNLELLLSTPDLFAESADWWERSCRGIDTVVHAAWFAKPGNYLRADENIDCLTGTLALAKGAIRANVRRFVGIGTCFEYDLEGGRLSVLSPLKPLTPYAAAKVAAFHILEQWLSVKKVEFSWCRLFYLFGEGEDDRRLVPYLRARLSSGQLAELSKGNQVRDFLDVKIAGGMIADIAMSSRRGPVNICSGVPVTIRELAEKIADEYGRRDLLRFGTKPERPMDPLMVVGIP